MHELVQQVNKAITLPRSRTRSTVLELVEANLLYTARKGTVNRAKPDSDSDTVIARLYSFHGITPSFVTECDPFTLFAYTHTVCEQTGSG